jgi:hypothetical protein
MSAVEASDVMREVGRWPVATQVRVALRTARIRCGSEAQMAAMLLMARRTIWLKGLICVVDRPIVA